MPVRSRISLDYTRMLAPALGGGRGIDPERLDTLADRFRSIQADVDRRREEGKLGFFELPYAEEVVERIVEFADGPGQAFQNVVVLGIGGSALGATALRTALRPPGWNELPDEARDHFPRLFVLDNVDPESVASLLDHIDPSTTLFNVVSKSGGTAETMSQFLIVRERLERELGDGYRRHLIFTTDPESGVLRRLADEEGVATLAVPQNVGGRFSVLSPVGLLPAALIGIPITQLLAGAREMDERCRTDSLADNPAALFAALQHLADTERNAPIHVMMPYADALRDVADWFRQLWAESLGKREGLDGEERFVGPTPVKALGATDQHSQLQLYMEGPFDKTVTFLAVDEPRRDVQIPSLYGDIPELGYLGGHTLGELLSAEREATAAALARAGRMSMTIDLPRIDAPSVGGLLHMLQVATVYAGALYGVNPLDQPGVELGKKLTYARMGREGYDDTGADAAGSDAERRVCG